MRPLRALLLPLLALGLVAAGLSPAQAVPAPGSVSGTVSVPAGYDMRDVQVMLVPVDAPSAKQKWLSGDGQFTITDVAPGTYRVAFGTLHRDMVVYYGTASWWTSPGVVDGRCDNSGCTGATTVTVESGEVTDLGSAPVLGYIPVHEASGTVTAPAGHTTAGVKLEIWLRSDGAYGHVSGHPAGWSPVPNIPAQTLGADGTFSFELLQGAWDHAYAIRAVDPSGTYAFSFGNQGLDATTPGGDVADFGAGSVGLHRLPTLVSDHAVGTLRLKLPVTATGGAVTISGDPQWGRTLSASSTATWSNPAVGTAFQWYLDGSAIDGATGATLSTDGDGFGQGSEVAVAAVPAGDFAVVGAPVLSDPVVLTSTAPFPKAPPTVGGSPRVAARLTAAPGTWAPTVYASRYTHTYRWLRDGQPISGATSKTYTPRSSDVGRRLSVRVVTDATPSCEVCQPPFPATGTADSTPTGVVRYTPKISLSTRKPSRSGHRVTLTVSVRAGGRPTAGRVVLKDGRKVIRTLRLRKGTAAHRVTLSKGRHRLTATVVQDTRLASVTTTRTYRVR